MQCYPGGGGEMYLEAEDFGLGEGERFAVDFDEAFALLGLIVSSGSMVWGSGRFLYTLQCATAVAERDGQRKAHFPAIV